MRVRGLVRQSHTPPAVNTKSLATAGVPLIVVTGAPGTAANLLLQALAAEMVKPVIFLTGPGARRSPPARDGLTVFNGGGGDVTAAVAAAAAAGPGATLVAEMPVLEDGTAVDTRQQRNAEHMDAVVSWTRLMRHREQRLIVRTDRPPDILLDLVPSSRLCVFYSAPTPVEHEWRTIAPELPPRDDLSLRTCAVLEWPSGRLLGVLTMDAR